MGKKTDSIEKNMKSTNSIVISSELLSQLKTRQEESAKQLLNQNLLKHHKIIKPYLKMKKDRFKNSKDINNIFKCHKVYLLSLAT